jgi:hypothetical protein
MISIGGTINAEPSKMRQSKTICTLAPTMVPPSPWSLASLRLKTNEVLRPLAGERDGGGRSERDDLVRRAEQHVEFDPGIEQGLGIELRQPGQRGALVKQAGPAQLTELLKQKLAG